MTISSQRSSLTMLTLRLLITVILVCSVNCQNAVNGRYVDADDFTMIAAEVTAMREERFEFNNRITQLETKLNAGEAKLNIIEDKLRVTETKLAATEAELRIVEDNMDSALSRIGKLEKQSGSLQDQNEMTGNKADEQDIGHETDMERNLSTATTQGRQSIYRAESSAGSGQKPTKRILQTTAQHIAFSAVLHASLQNIVKLQPIKFDRVDLNAGNAYDVMTGVFICPVSGVYMFQSAIQIAYNSYIETEIVKDGALLVKVYAARITTSYDFDQGFNSVITTCNQGESVWVRLSKTLITTLNGGRYSTFSGFLLWEI